MLDGWALQATATVGVRVVAAWSVNWFPVRVFAILPGGKDAVRFHPDCVKKT